MVDTPELFGGELRILAAIDFVDGKNRPVGWDSSAFNSDLYTQFRTPAESARRELFDRSGAISQLVGDSQPRDRRDDLRDAVAVDHAHQLRRLRAFTSERVGLCLSHTESLLLVEREQILRGMNSPACRSRMRRRSGASALSTGRVGVDVVRYQWFAAGSVDLACAGDRERLPVWSDGPARADVDDAGRPSLGVGQSHMEPVGESVVLRGPFSDSPGELTCVAPDLVRMDDYPVGKEGQHDWFALTLPRALHERDRRVPCAAEIVGASGNCAHRCSPVGT
jgi:hypothetical protein